MREDSAELFEKMRGIGLHTVAFTLHGLREHHDWFVCREGAFDDILLSTRRARAAGFQVNWQIFVDRKGIADVLALVEMAARECSWSPQLGIPAHRVGGRLRSYEAIRPTLGDVRRWRLDKLLDDPRANSLLHPEELTTAAWLERWRRNPEGDEFRHMFEPRSWPVSLNYEWLAIRIRRDRRVFLDPMSAPPIRLGHLSEGKEALLTRIPSLPAPAHVSLMPDEVEFLPEEQDQLHPSGISVRYKAISIARQHDSRAVT